MAQLVAMTTKNWCSFHENLFIRQGHVNDPSKWLGARDPAGTEEVGGGGGGGLDSFEIHWKFPLSLLNFLFKRFSLVFAFIFFSYRRL